MDFIPLYIQIPLLTFAGLFVFLYGIKLMGTNLELYAGDKIKHYISKHTTNPLKGLFIGAISTGIIQSSSGTTAIAISLVRSKLMSFKQSFGIIVGANIGTTVTAFLIGLNMYRYSPIIIIIGFLISLFKKNNIPYLGKSIIGFGAIFIGLYFMSYALVPFRSLPWFHHYIVALSNKPILSLGISSLFTAIIQSSSATIALIQTLYSNNLITLIGTIPLVLGANVGTTITSFLASIGGSIEAKRTAYAHIFFNIFGALFFLSFIKFTEMFITYLLKYIELYPLYQIAIVHLIFNVIVALHVLPFTKYITRFIEYIIPNKN